MLSRHKEFDMTNLSMPGQSLDAQLGAINQQIIQGQLEQAVEAALRLRKIHQAKVPATALLALAYALKGQAAEAQQVLTDFPQADQLDSVEVLLAVGSAWFKLGDPRFAIGYLDAAHQKAPDHSLVTARLAACLLALGRVDQALPMLKLTVDLMPQSGGAWLNLARGYLNADQYEAAQQALDKAALLPDKEVEIFTLTQAEVLRALGRERQAIDVLKGVKSLGAVELLVETLSSLGDHDQAWFELRQALEQYPNEVRLLVLAAELAQVRGRMGEADHYLEEALKVEPDNHALWRRRALLAARFNPRVARVAADKAVALTREIQGVPYALALAAHAHVLVDEELHEQAEQTYREALSLVAACIPALSGLGQLLMQLGRVDEAVECYEKVREIAPMHGWDQLIHARQIPEDPSVLEQMEAAAHRPSMEGPVRTNLLFTLAAAWEKKKNYEKAWGFAVEANMATKLRLPYRPEVHRSRVEREIAKFSTTFMQSRKNWGSQSHVPVFVLGMPRSGTTLVEQILGSHSQVYGAGELSLVPELIQKFNAWERHLGTRREYPECVDDLSQAEACRFANKHLQELQAYAPEALRIVDKLPHNFEHIGLIKLIFPNAKILHLKREPRDVAMSNFFTDYGAKFGGMGFAYDLSWIGEQLVDHDRLMRHWHEVFPGELLEVDYDGLVDDVEGWAHQIIDYLQLPWEKGVLQFQELNRAVKTASVWQVRQPVYTSSKARWKNYEAHLAALELALAEVPPVPTPAPIPILQEGLFPQGMAFLEEGKPQDAQRCFEQLLQARPAHAAAHHFLGAALYAQGRLHEARVAMLRSLELHEHQPRWQENLRKIEIALQNATQISSGSLH
jgi:tetratricopeptide (TPR) repeat protein